MKKSFLLLIRFFTYSLISFFLIIPQVLALDCQGKKNGTPCDDGNICTGNDVCFNNKCQGTTTANPGVGCDDKESCTFDDICIFNTCIGTPKDCQKANDIPNCKIGACVQASGECISYDYCKGTGYVCNKRGSCSSILCSIEPCPDNQICCSSTTPASTSSTSAPHCKLPTQCGKCETGGGCTSCIPIPGCDPNAPPDFVNLSSFTAIQKNGSIQLNIKTGAEINNAGFRIWRFTKDSKGEYTITALSEPNAEIPQCSGKDNSKDIISSCKTSELVSIGFNRNSKLISTIGNSKEGACYSLTDISVMKNKTYYYVIEDVDIDNKSTFHCKKEEITATTIGQDLPIDLESAADFCKQKTKNVN